ncbi:MAG: hypothetical protein GEU99_05270 [Luteitalea sp.]|nr:hypothetical protein [Luteitalea sp.]
MNSVLVCSTRDILTAATRCPRTLLATGAGLLVIALPLALCAQEAEDDSRAPSHPLVSRFLTRADEPVHAYRARRRLEAHNPRFRKEAWLEAWTWLDPENGFRFAIIAEGGSKYIRNRVLRRALETEQRTIAAGDAARASLSETNYTFEGAETIENGLLMLRIKPKRKDMLLVDGSLLVTDDADLLEIAGRLAKGPSFWTPRVEIRRRYERRSAVRVPVFVESTAHVRIAGRSEFRMTYEYESVNGRPVSAWFGVAGSR